MSFVDPARTVPETARLLRSGGLLAFSAETPLHFICWDDAVGVALRHNYFEQSALRCAAATLWSCTHPIKHGRRDSP
jgi:hypothetical protein